MILRDYQIDIANKANELLIKYKIAYLAMQTRTGKTTTALYAAALYGAVNVLFVTKKKVITSIQTDYNKMAYPFSITVINYESVHKVKGVFDLIICDEASCIGQFPKPNNRCKTMKQIAVGKPIIYLSATSSPESYSQLYHQFWISSYSPFSQYKNFYRFADDFVTIKKKYLYNREINDYSDCNGAKLFKVTRHLFLTYTQEQAGFKVKVTEKVLRVQLPDSLHKIIKTLNKNKIYVDNGFEIVADTAVKLMQKTHQLCSGTVIDENDYNIVSDYKAKFIKDNFKGQKLAIFYKFKSEGEMLKNVFPNFSEVAEEFQEGDRDVFLGQFLSAREGIRLDKADAIIFLNIDHAFLSYEQAKNRIASFERKESAILYWLFSDKGIEWRIYNQVNAKKNYTISHFNHDRRSI